MDMSNATIGGPSRGLLDVIFGSSKEAEQPDGQDNPLMNLIKALNKDQEDNSQSPGAGRTDKGTIAGSNSAESRVVGIPEMLMQMGVIQEAKPEAANSLRDEKAEEMAELIQMQQMQKLHNLSMQQLPMAANQLGIQPTANFKPLEAEQVNAALKANNLPPLTEAETKLLAEVNKQLVGIDPKGADPKVADRMEKAELRNFILELQKRGIDPEKIREAAVSASSAPEKIMSTEAYLKMHDAMQKPVAKDQADPSQKVLAGALANAKDPGNLEGMGQEGKSSSDMFGGSGERSNLLGKLGEDSKPNLRGNGMEAGFLHSLKTQLDSGKVESQNIYLPVAKPELMKGALVNEVANTVNMQALKGGGEMRLVVHPPELGELKLKIGTKEGGNVEVHVTAQNDNVANMVREGSDQLQNSLKEQHLTLSKFEVAVSDSTNIASADSKGSSMDQSFQQNQQQSSFSQGFARGDERSSARWDGGEQNQRPGSGFGNLMQNIDTKRLAAKRAESSRVAAGRSASGRLDVVA